jgi:hypothetical protein
VKSQWTLLGLVFAFVSNAAVAAKEPPANPCPGPIESVTDPAPVDVQKLIETMQTFNFEGTLIYVKIDFAYQDEKGLKIVDWKTGRTERQGGWIA